MSARNILWSALFVPVVLCAEPVTLNDFVIEVVQTHPEVMQRVHSFRQLSEDTELAKKGWRPSIDLTGSAGRYQTNSPSTGLDTQSYSSKEVALTLTQPLFDGFETRHAVNQAEARAVSEMYRVLDDADNIALEATGAYLDALEQKELFDLAMQNVLSHEEILNKIRQRSGYGVGRRSDEEQTRARLALARSGLIAQQNNLEDSLSRLHSLIGRYIAVEDLQSVTTLPASARSLEDMTDIALDQHPALKSAYFNIQAVNQDYERQDSNWLPDVSLQVQSRIGSDLDGTDGRTRQNSASLNFRYNLYNGGSDSATRRKKLASMYEYRDYAARTRRQVIETLRLAWMADAATTAQMGYLNDYVDTSRRTLALYTEEFFVGQRTLIDILDSESEYNNSRVNRARAVFSNQQARYRLAEGQGKMFEVLGMQVSLTGEQIQLQQLTLNEQDTLPANTDPDADQSEELRDQCDNSVRNRKVDQWGCADRPRIKVPAERPEIQPEVWTEQLNFVYDSVELTAEGQQRMSAVLTRLQQLPADLYVEVHAHTDDRGSDEYNRDLSQRRADRIRELMIAGGISAQRVKSIGDGEGFPVADNSSEAGRLQNRRVEFRIFGWTGK